MLVESVGGAPFLPEVLVRTSEAQHGPNTFWVEDWDVAPTGLGHVADRLREFRPGDVLDPALAAWSGHSRPVPSAPIHAGGRGSRAWASTCLEPQGVGDWCWCLGVLLNYFADGVRARKHETPIEGAPDADLASGALAESRQKACEHFVSRVLWYLEEDDVDEWSTIFNDAKSRNVSYQ